MKPNMQNLNSGERAVFAFSGGADSSALLHFLCNSNLGLKILVVHINHGLRGSASDDDELFCNQTAMSYGAEFVSYKLNSTAFSEESGRDFRYAKFGEAAKLFGAEKIITAHNRDDNAETLLMRFLRGTGRRGLAGIPPTRQTADGLWVIRPLLPVPRLEIMSYLASNGIPFRNDTTNAENIYTRNKIRNELIPYIQSNFNPRITDTLADAAAIIEDEELYLSEMAQEMYHSRARRKESGQVCLNTDGLSSQRGFIVNRVLRMAYAAVSLSMKDLGAAHIHALAALLTAERGKSVSLPGNIRAEAGADELIFSRNDTQPLAEFCYPTDLSAPCHIPERDALVVFAATEKDFCEKTIDIGKKVYTICVTYDKMISDYVFRTRCAGDMLKVQHKNSDGTYFTKKLKDFLNAAKLSKAERTELFYLAEGSLIHAIFSGNNILYTGGLIKWAKK